MSLTIDHHKAHHVSRKARFGLAHITPEARITKLPTEVNVSEHAQQQLAQLLSLTKPLPTLGSSFTTVARFVENHPRLTEQLFDLHLSQQELNAPRVSTQQLLDLRNQHQLSLQEKRDFSQLDHLIYKNQILWYELLKQSAGDKNQAIAKLIQTESKFTTDHKKQILFSLSQLVLNDPELMTAALRDGLSAQLPQRYPWLGGKKASTANGQETRFSGKEFAENLAQVYRYALSTGFLASSEQAGSPHLEAALWAMHLIDRNEIQHARQAANQGQEAVNEQLWQAVQDKTSSEFVQFLKKKVWRPAKEAAATSRSKTDAATPQATISSKARQILRSKFHPQSMADQETN